MALPIEITNTAQEQLILKAKQFWDTFICKGEPTDLIHPGCGTDTKPEYINQFIVPSKRMASNISTAIRRYRCVECGKMFLLTQEFIPDSLSET